MAAAITLAGLMLIATNAGCQPVPNPGVCCTSDAECAQLGGIAPRGCPDGFVCRELLCEEATCASHLDCPDLLPVCDGAAASCTGCTNLEDCAARPGIPVCDPESGACRGCETDSDCPSEACEVDSGECLDENQILYASPTGMELDKCSHLEPCSISRAITIASADHQAVTIRMLPGTYITPIQISSGTMNLLGSGAILRPIVFDQDALRVQGTANVKIHQLEIDGHSPASLNLVGVRCEGTATSTPRLDLRSSTIHPFIAVKHAELEIQSSLVGFTLTLQDRATVAVDRSRFRSTRGLPAKIDTSGKNYNLRVTNSIFQDFDVTPMQAQDLSDTSTFYMGHNTFSAAHSLRCKTGAQLRFSIFENNILFSTSTGPAVSMEPAHSCAFLGNLAYPQDVPLDGPNLVAPPSFVDHLTGDFRLSPDSPAIDTALPNPDADLNHDFTGGPRPVGPAKDIGAYEFRP